VFPVFDSRARREGDDMTTIQFPAYSGVRCLMMPYIQGDPESVPDVYAPYRDIVSTVFLRNGDIGFLTIDESLAVAGKPHRGAHAKHGRALHTEAGIVRGVTGWGDPPAPSPGWGHPRPGWGGRHTVTLDRNVKVLIASNLDDTCAVWDAEHENTSEDGDIGYAADLYPYGEAAILKAGELREIGIFTPHESLPVKRDVRRQFIRVVSSGVHGREPYFTENPLLPWAG
jgi:hypothetical protein